MGVNIKKILGTAFILSSVFISSPSLAFFLKVENKLTKATTGCSEQPKKECQGLLKTQKSRRHCRNKYHKKLKKWCECQKKHHPTKKYAACQKTDGAK